MLVVFAGAGDAAAAAAAAAAVAAAAAATTAAAYMIDRTGQDRTGQDWTRPDWTGLDWTGQDRTRQDKTGQDRTRQDRTGQDRTGWRHYCNCCVFAMRSAIALPLCCGRCHPGLDSWDANALFTVIPAALLVFPDTLKELGERIRWSFRILHSGVHPLCDCQGNPFPNWSYEHAVAGQPICGRA